MFAIHDRMQRATTDAEATCQLSSITTDLSCDRLADCVVPGDCQVTGQLWRVTDGACWVNPASWMRQVRPCSAKRGTDYHRYDLWRENQQTYYKVVMGSVRGLLVILPNNIILFSHDSFNFKQLVSCNRAN